MKNTNREPPNYDMSFYSAEELEMISVFEAQLQFYQELERLHQVYIPLPDNVFQEDISPQKDEMHEA